MILRPHHLLCTQGYSGHGYSDDFVQNMNYWVDRMRHEDTFTISLRCSTDDLCSHCPNKLDEGLCKDDAKVLKYDAAVMRLFHLEEKDYHYKELIREIDAHMTKESFESICGNCEWHKMSQCAANILSQKYC